jgi:hypothetical protein
VSHAWARTVDGAQGGTWDHAHLLGTATLDAYRGYTAQSRSIQPTHTWNTATLPTIDFGGQLARDPDPEHQVAAALSRVPDTTMAAVSDPWTVDRELRQLIAAHQDHLDRQPPDRQRELDHAVRQLTATRTSLAAAQAAVDDVRHDREEIGVLAPFSRHGRAERRARDARLHSRQAAAIDAAGPVATALARVERLTREQAAHHCHDRQHGWRRDAIDNAREQLDQHWTDVALACVRADQTLAYGVEPLRIGRRHLAGQLSTIENSLPPDRSGERDTAHETLRARTVARRDAEQQLARTQAALDEQLGRRWPRRDKTAIAQATNDVDAARRHLTESRSSEAKARGHLTELNHHQQARAGALADTATERHALTDAIRQLDTALHLNRVDRVLQLADQPTQLHLDVLGPPPAGAAARAVWSHQAHRLEHHLDHTIGTDSTWQALVHDLSATSTLTRIADRHIAIHPHQQLRPADWAHITEQASAIHATAIEHARPATRHGLKLELGL